ncbi:hypothetical protein HOY80DRAFT_1020221 [Tuber brumale]|nr:hypothetical protein HOY80DRAFT_1020221 [Tuber brumale]
MVSFSCEICSDILKKPKLDSHAARCRGAYYTCIDCSKTFVEGQWKGHTSCISEAEKYQGSFYKPEKGKGKGEKGMENGATITADTIVTATAPTVKGKKEKKKGSPEAIATPAAEISQPEAKDTPIADALPAESPDQPKSSKKEKRKSKKDKKGRKDKKSEASLAIPEANPDPAPAAESPDQPNPPNEEKMESKKDGKDKKSKDFLTAPEASPDFAPAAESPDQPKRPKEEKRESKKDKKGKKSKKKSKNSLTAPEASPDSAPPAAESVGNKKRKSVSAEDTPAKKKKRKSGGEERARMSQEKFAELVGEEELGLVGFLERLEKEVRKTHDKDSEEAVLQGLRIKVDGGKVVLSFEG